MLTSDFWLTAGQSGTFDGLLPVTDTRSLPLTLSRTFLSNLDFIARGYCCAQRVWKRRLICLAGMLTVYAWPFGSIDSLMKFP